MKLSQKFWETLVLLFVAFILAVLTLRSTPLRVEAVTEVQAKVDAVVIQKSMTAAIAERVGLEAIKKP
jgi:hypothetical protein